MDPRIYFFQKLVNDPSKRILELGPLNRPIVDKNLYPNTFYCDVRSTEDVRKLYSGNDYLEATGIRVDPETIVPIDYVIQENYEKTFEKVEKFDYVIASHVLEHMEDLIFALRDISAVLKPGGTFCIVYPDKRYCFDHFRTSASFRDAYRVFRNGTTENSSMVLDFYYSVIPENNPYLFWRKDGILDHLPKASFEKAVDHYEEALNGVKMDDVHYWPFSDMDFLKLLYDCIRARLLPFHCTSFWPCMENGQQFMVALQYDQNVLSHPEQALEELTARMKDAVPDYYSSKDIMAHKECENLKVTADEQKEIIRLQEKTIDVLEKHISIQEKKLELQEQAQSSLESKIDELKEIIKEQEYVIGYLQGDTTE